MRQQLVSAALVSMLSFSIPAYTEEIVIQANPSNSLEWETTPEGVAFAPLIGDRFEESYMAMVRLPAGTVSPPHTKTANMFGVILSGSMVHSALDVDPEDDVILAEGAFYKIPGNMPHVSKCVSEKACITFLYQDGKFDFLPVKPQEAK